MNVYRWIRRPLPYVLYPYSMTLMLIGVTALVFLAQMVAPAINTYIVMNPYLVVNKGFVWTVATYMFAHGGFSHILFNMLGLYFFGTPLERMWGSNEFLLLYLLFGTVSGIISFIFYVIFGDWGVFLLGASGAVFGVMLAFTAMFPHARIYIFGIFPVTARVLMIIYIVLQILMLQGGGSGVAYLTHLSGIAVAWVYMLVRHSVDPFKRIFRGRQ